ncbi:hypothetical protein FOZ62_029755 [Perkinsus olseni]|uniref:Uncharacterized protein n=1 Tax=Perkinsus olseni TaxID=32597 RepID=A0A7J6QJM0_PEROL|nr:hypothetical protein FOZ62_029755 [Perkinsus olseni]
MRFRDAQVQHCKRVFWEVEGNKLEFGRFWDSTIVLVGDGIICLGCGDCAVWSPCSTYLLEQHLNDWHTGEMLQGSGSPTAAKYPSRKQREDFEYPVGYDDCPSSDEVKRIAVAFSESAAKLKFWCKFAASNHLRHCAVRDRVARGVLSGKVLDAISQTRKSNGQTQSPGAPPFKWKPPTAGNFKRSDTSIA